MWPENAGADGSFPRQTLNARASLREEMRTTRFNGVELPVRMSFLIRNDKKINDSVFQGNMSRLKASEFSVGIARTEPGDTSTDQISMISSGGREKDVISIA